jgi:O-methyltransferase involved in polyketide biosynthesis
MATEQAQINLGDVQKTLLLPLWGRAEESKKRNPLLVDEAAIRIIERIDFDFSQITQSMDDLTQIAWIKRSLFCDRAIIPVLAHLLYYWIFRMGRGRKAAGRNQRSGQ